MKVKGTSREEVDRASATIAIEANIILILMSNTKTESDHICMSGFQEG